MQLGRISDDTQPLQVTFLLHFAVNVELVGNYFGCLFPMHFAVHAVLNDLYEFFLYTLSPKK